MFANPAIEFLPVRGVAKVADFRNRGDRGQRSEKNGNDPHPASPRGRGEDLRTEKRGVLNSPEVGNREVVDG